MENQQASAEQKSLTLLNMSSAFLIFGLGVTVATLVFLIELTYKRIQDHYFIDNKVHPCSTEDNKNQCKSNENDQTDANDELWAFKDEEQTSIEDMVSDSDDKKHVNKTLIASSDDVQIKKVGTGNVYLIDVSIHNDEDKIIADQIGGKKIDRKLIRYENCDSIEIEELDSLIQTNQIIS